MTCEVSYGFLPCSEDLRGSIFLMVVYGYFLLQGASMLSDGSELLLEVLDPGVVGGLLLPVLGALPDATIIIISGLGPAEDMPKLVEEVSVGMGTLAGSTVMLLTIAWAGSVILGRCDLNADGVAINKTLTKTTSLTETGVSSDAATPFNAIIMVVTCLLYFTVQIPGWMGNTHPHMPALLGFIACFATLAAYCGYQVLVPELQKRKIAYLRTKAMRHNMITNLHAFASSMFGSLVDENGAMKRSVVDQLFHHFDHDRSGTIDSTELQALLTGLELCTSTDAGGLSEHVTYFMKEFDADSSGAINKDEFFIGMQKWVGERVAQVKQRISAGHNVSSALAEEESTSVSVPLLPAEQHGGGEEDEESSDEPPLTKKQLITKAIGLLILGTFVCGIFADPMVGAVTGFATATKIPAFFIAFVVTPLASNASELVSSLKFAMGKKQRNISLTFCQVYGAVTMNNCLCLGLFLVIIYSRGLDWTFGPEVLSTVIPTLVMGIVGASSVTFKTWMAIPVLLLYPAALLLVWALKQMEHKD